MPELDFVQVALRWLHIGSAIVLVGGSFFLRVALMPAAAALPNDEHARLRERVIGRWKRAVHATILLLLISGLWNFIKLMGDRTAVWHALVGTKILLAVVAFFIASALVGRSAGLQPIRDKAPTWLAVNLVIATLIVLLSGVARYLPPKGTTTGAAQVAPIESVSVARR